MSAAASTSKDGEEVFSESRSLLFKSLKVKRLVDKEGESIVYAVFSQRLDKNEDANNSRFKSALCAVRSPHRTRVLPPRHRSAPTACALRRRCTWTSLRRPRRRSKTPEYSRVCKMPQRHMHATSCGHGGKRVAGSELSQEHTTGEKDPLSAGIKLSRTFKKLRRAIRIICRASLCTPPRARKNRKKRATHRHRGAAPRGARAGRPRGRAHSVCCVCVC